MAFAGENMRYVYEWCREDDASLGRGYDGRRYEPEGGAWMSVGGHDVEKIRGRIAALRNAGYDPRKFDRVPARALNGYDKRYLEKDMAFILSRGIDVLTEGDERYPEAFARHLGSGRPRMLFLKGNLSLLDRPAILVCGSRDATDRGLDFTYRCGRLIAEEGYTVISGYARGVDLAAHQGALEGGGDTVALVPYGLSRFSRRSVPADLPDEHNFLVGGELPPTCGFTVRAALRRNKFLAALSLAIIVVEPGESGGSWFTAKRARDMGKPLFYFAGERTDSIGRMESLGGRPLTLRRKAPVLDEVYEQCG